MVFENGVKNIQAAAYNGARTVHIYNCYCEVVTQFSAYLHIYNSIFKFLVRPFAGKVVDNMEPLIGMHEDVVDSPPGLHKTD